MIDKINSWHYVITIDTKNEKENEVIWDLIDVIKTFSKCGFPITIEATPIMEEVELDEDI